MSTRQAFEKGWRSLSEPLRQPSSLLFLGGRYGDKDYHRLLLRRILEQLSATVGDSPRGQHYSVWDDLRYYPLLLGLYGIGIGSLSGGHPETLAGLLRFAPVTTASTEEDLYPRHVADGSSSLINSPDLPNAGESTQLKGAVSRLCDGLLLEERLSVVFDQLEYLFELIDAHHQLGPSLEGDVYPYPREFWFRLKRPTMPIGNVGTWVAPPYDQIWTENGLFDGEVTTLNEVRMRFDSKVESQRAIWRVRGPFQ
jgi:hypothetical protein